MARHAQPPLKDKPVRQKAKIKKTEYGSSVAIEVREDDPTRETQEGNVRLFLDQALRRFQMADDAETYDRIQGLKDVMMVDGEGQWDEDIRAKRVRKKRPCLTLNRFIPMIAHVANEQRMSKPSIQIDPVGDGADPDSAEIRQGLIRHIEVTSNAETAYDTAFERMLEKGWSWLRVIEEWESPLSHNQVIKIEGFANDFCVYGDPNAEDPTRKDMKWAFVVYDMPRGEYSRQYKNSKAASLTNFESVGDWAPGWLTTDSVRLAEYYYIEEEEAYSVRLVDGNGVWEDQIEERFGEWYYKEHLKGMDEGWLEPEAVAAGALPVDLDDNGQPVKRKSYRPKVKWCKINAVEILEGDQGDDIEKNTAGREIAGQSIPLIHVCGRERVVKGQRRRSGMVRNNRDAQRIYNYLASGFVEMVALAPRSPFIAAIGQIEEFKTIWDSLNEENWPVLPYKPRDVAGQLVPAPQRQENRIAESVLGFLQGLHEFDNMIKSGFNIFDPSLGTAKSDQSGRAVAALQAQSDTANANWLDNQRRAIIRTGEVILEKLPIIYDSKRTIIIDRANQRESIVINAEFKNGKGELKNYDMAIGKYSCRVSLGEYATKRQEAVRSLTDIAKNAPQVSLALLPLILDNMDSPMAKEAAALVKRLQPPELQDPGSPEQMKAQFTQLMKQHQLLVKALEQANEVIRTKQLDNASKEFIAGVQAQSQMAIASAKLGSAEGISLLTQEYKRLTDLWNMNHERLLQEAQQAHELTLQANEPEPAGATA